MKKKNKKFLKKYKIAIIIVIIIIVALLYYNQHYNQQSKYLLCDVQRPVYDYLNSSKTIGFACSLQEAKALCSKYFYGAATAQEIIIGVGFECLQFV